MDFFHDVLGEAIVLGVDSLILGICVKQLLKCRDIIHSLNNAPNLEVNRDLDKELNKYPNKTISYVALRGLIKPLGNPIKSSSNDSINGVIQKLTIKEHVVARTSAGFWSDQSRTLHEVFNTMPFVITDNKVNIEILDPLEANILDMDVISDRFEPLTSSLLDHVWGYFSGVRQRGLQTTEEMLRCDTLITAIGELSLTGGGILKLQPPRDGLPLYLITSSKNSLLKKITESRDILRLFVTIFGSVAVLISGRMLLKYLRRKKKLAADEKLKKQLALSRRERRALARDKHLLEAQLCVVCSENPKEIILLPCGHVCLCEDCSDNIKSNCPVCRSIIESKAPAFIT